jgi:hypothetical protein
MPEYGFNEYIEARSEALAYQFPERRDPLQSAIAKEVGRLLDAKTECQRVLDGAGVVEPRDVGGVADRDGSTGGDAVARAAGLAVKVALLALMALPSVAQTIFPASRRDWGATQQTICQCGGALPSNSLKYSQAFMLAGATADVVSSRGLIERNPLLGAGPFGARQAATSMAITAGLVALETPIVRRWPSMRRALTITNYLVGSIRFGVAAKNWRLR